MSALSKDKTVGILGGMGPAATVDLMQRIITLTPAEDDIDHIHCLVDNDPKVPSRIKALIEKNGEDPGPYLVKMARGLQDSGADFLAIACNTAHYYYQTIQQAVDIPVINMIESVLADVQEKYSNCTRVALLASPAIQITKLYQTIFNSAGIEIVYPVAQDQALLFTVIKQIKAGNLDHQSRDSYQLICNRLATINHVHLAIVACTELSALGGDCSLQLVDAADSLARKIISTASQKLV